MNTVVDVLGVIEKYILHSINYDHTKYIFTISNDLTMEKWLEKKHLYTTQLAVIRSPVPTLEGIRVAFGRNTKSGIGDYFVGFRYDQKYRIWRYSGRRKKWIFHRETFEFTNYLTHHYEHVDQKSLTIFRTQEHLSEFVLKSNQSNHNQVEKGNVMSLNKVLGKFGKAEKGAFALSANGEVAIKRKEGGYACFQEGVLVNIDDFALELDAFYYLPCPMTDLQPLDVVSAGQHLGFVMEIATGDASKEVRIYDVNSESVITVKPAVHFLMKEPFITKVVSLLNFGGGGCGCGGGMDNSLMFMMLAGGLGEGKMDMEKMVLFSMLGGQKVGLNNPLMLMMLLGEGEGKMKDLLPLIMFGGGNLFGHKCTGEEVPAATPA